MGPYTLSQNGERLAESGIYWYFTQTIKSLNFMNLENLGFCFQTSGLELHPTFSQGSEAQGIYIYQVVQDFFHQQYLIAILKQFP